MSADNPALKMLDNRMKQLDAMPKIVGARATVDDIRDLERSIILAAEAITHAIWKSRY